MAEAGDDAPYVGEALTSDGKVELRAAALDAHRVCRIPIASWSFTDPSIDI